MKTTKIALIALMCCCGMIPSVAQNVCTNQTKKCETACSNTPRQENPYLLMGGPGIVTSESATPQQLPQAAQQFLQTYYSRVMVGKIMRNVVNNTYNVELGNGVKVTFDAKGKVQDIQSPGTDPLYEPAVKAILPEKAYKHLEDAGLLPDVTGIKNADGKGLRVQLLNAMPPEMLFDVDGLFIIVDD